MCVLRGSVICLRLDGISSSTLILLLLYVVRPDALPAVILYPRIGWQVSAGTSATADQSKVQLVKTVTR